MINNSNFSHRIFRLNARKTCPDCRTNIHEKTDIKPVYAHLMSPDSSHKDELQRAKSDNDALRRQLFDVKSNLTVVKRQLTTEKARNTRLNTKLGKISKQMTEINGKDVSPKRAFKVSDWIFRNGKFYC